MNEGSSNQMRIAGWRNSLMSRLEERDARRRRKERRLVEPDSVNADFRVALGFECELEALTPAAGEWFARTIPEWDEDDGRTLRVDRENPRLVRFSRHEVKWDVIQTILVRDEAFKLDVRDTDLEDDGDEVDPWLL